MNIQKKVKINYWNELERVTKEKVLTVIFPSHRDVMLVKKLARDKPSRYNPLWRDIFANNLRMSDRDGFRIIANNTYIV